MRVKVWNISRSPTTCECRVWRGSTGTISLGIGRGTTGGGGHSPTITGVINSIWVSFFPTQFSTVKPPHRIKALNLNFGPQHPAAHGVLRLILQLDGEVVQKSDIHIGLLHRGTEKLIETKPYLLSLPYFDRLDYVSVLVQEHAYCLAVEKLKARTNFQQRTSATRTIFDELTRILNHLLAVSCHALDVGSMSPLFWAFEEREVIMGFYEGVSGARFHAAYYRPGFANVLLNAEVLYSIARFGQGMVRTLNEMANTLTENGVWKQRLVNVGAYSPTEVQAWGLTGVMARCTGLKKDVRLNKRTTYGNYFFLNPTSYVTLNGDSYDRYLLRMAEMLESVAIINKSLVRCTPAKPNIWKKFYKYRNLWLCKSEKRPAAETTLMEEVVRHFKYWSEGFRVEKGITTQLVESPKGELGVTLLADGTARPYRCKIRSPAYNHIQFLPRLTQGVLLADLVTLIGTVDIVFGEIDR